LSLRLSEPGDTQSNRLIRPPQPAGAFKAEI